MAPNNTVIRVSELEAEVSKLTLRMNAIAKDAETIEEEVKALNNAVFGDRNNPDDRPGIVYEVREMRKIVGGVKEALNKLIWLIVASLVTGVATWIASLFSKH